MGLNDLIISGDGRRGINGTPGETFVGHSPAYGGKGADGGHATVPTAGDDAFTVHVSFARPDATDLPDNANPNAFLVATIDTHRHPCMNSEPHSIETITRPHDLKGDGDLIVSACGGNGGDGGAGGHGQGGGNGMHGIDATRHNRGTDGQAGGNGGDGGHGTSGAKGGRAGEVSVFIREKDMDLLLAMPPPRVQGGRGGCMGVNGLPGAGGNGGDGGASYSWVEYYRSNDTVYSTTHTNPGGAGGPGGMAGRLSTAVLQPGKNGDNASVRISVRKENGKVDGPFSTSYKLEILDFDIVDGNDDEIYEFGDEITLTNIRVINNGECFSPSMSQVTVRGKSSDWLIAPQTTLLVQKCLLGGSIDTLEGTFTFKVKRPTTFPVGRPFAVRDGVGLGGYMSGIERAVRGFHTPRKIPLQHPIEMNRFRSLRCVAAGQEALITWTVDNISSKELGVDSPSGRQIVLVVDEARSVSQKAPEAPISQTPEIAINRLGPRTGKAMEVSLKIDADAVPYTRKEPQLSLCLTPPGGTEPYPIQEHHFPIQISSTFNHSKEAEVLLVTNLNTSADEVETWRRRCNRLKLPMDVWNVSLNGHLELIGDHPQRIAGESKLFNLYKGKTIVILDNSFQYFERGQRNATDFIDHRDFAPAAMDGTSLFISGTELGDDQIEHLKRYLRAGSYPLRQEFKTVKQQLKMILSSQNDPRFYDTKFVCLPTPRGDHSVRCEQKAARVAGELHRRLPNIRFIISWIAGAANGCAGEVEVMPCTSYSRSKFIVTRPLASNSEEINTFGLLLLLPLSTRLEILWDSFNGAFVERESVDVMMDTVEYEMAIELARYIHSNPPWPDCIRQEDIFPHLQRLDLFFRYNTAHPFSGESIERVVTILGTLRLLADCCPGFWPRSWTFGTRRKRLRSELDRRVEMFLSSHYGPVECKVAQAQFKEYIKKQKKELNSNDSGNRLQKLRQRILAKVPISTGPNTGVVDFEITGNISRNHHQAVHWKGMDSSSRLGEDLAHAKSELRALSRSTKYY